MLTRPLVERLENALSFDAIRYNPLKRLLCHRDDKEAAAKLNWVYDGLPIVLLGDAKAKADAKEALRRISNLF
jgi:hypothetical protein